MLILIAVLGTTAITRSLPSSTLQLQASRDTLVAAFFSAQQKAMSQTKAVRLITLSNSIDVRVDANNDGNFSAGESANLGGTQFPLMLIADQSLTITQFDFDRLGRTNSATLTLSQGGRIGCG